MQRFAAEGEQCQHTAVAENRFSIGEVWRGGNAVVLHLRARRAEFGKLSAASARAQMVQSYDGWGVYWLCSGDGVCEKGVRGNFVGAISVA